MHPHSPFVLPNEVFDGSSGLRTKVYWAQLIAVVLVTPVSFAINKIWTFRRVRTHGTDRSPMHPPAAGETRHRAVDDSPDNAPASR